MNKKKKATELRWNLNGLISHGEFISSLPNAVVGFDSTHMSVSSGKFPFWLAHPVLAPRCRFLGPSIDPPPPTIRLLMYLHLVN